MPDATAMAQERQQIYKDLYRGNVPTRLLIGNALGLEAVCHHAGVDTAEIYWDMTKALAPIDKACEDFPTDSSPGGTRRYPSYYHLLGARPFKMSSNGSMQHPEVHGMEVEDYPDLIAKPYDTIIEKILPRLYTALDKSPMERAFALAKSYNAHTAENATLGANGAQLRAKYGFAGPPSAATTAPFDFVADFFRGFTGVVKDIRRMPGLVNDASYALLPLLLKKGQIPVGAELGVSSIPLHMGPFLGTKEFDKYYWPSLKDQVEQLTQMGANVSLFVEADYKRFYDHLYDLPERSILRFEMGDPQEIKDKFGKKFVLGGLYPLTLLISGTKEACLDKAKSLIDICMPGGGYTFDFDKSAFDMNFNITENYKAVLDYAWENGKYSEAQRAGNKEPAPWPNRSVEIVSEIEKNMNSKYYTTWEGHKAQSPELERGIDNVIGSKLTRFEDSMFNYIINLCS
ncbi:MAG: uroporphyrinogen decarboxylase [Eubacteriaceae bacterium]|nr:uroporphyrinogen decarboxylase [Eubacteriaceae bacterium]